MILPWLSGLRSEVQFLGLGSTTVAAFPLNQFAVTIEKLGLTMSLRILIADDNRAVRHGLHTLLEQEPNWTVCAEAVDGADAIEKAQICRPDIVILDFFMPRVTGVEAARALTRLLPSVPVLLVTLYLTAELVAQAKSVGIRGAVSKSDPRQIVNGVDALMNKVTFFKESYDFS